MSNTAATESRAAFMPAEFHEFLDVAECALDEQLEGLQRRYAAASRGGWIDTFALSTTRPSTPYPGMSDIVFAPVRGWALKGEEDSLPYGGVWQRHGKRFNLVRLDGSAKSATLADLSQGCDVRPTWGGAITDASIYTWYPRN